MLPVTGNPKHTFYLFIAAALLVNFAGITNRFFTDDPALYASIAKNLLHQKNIFELFTYNQDWLDKPHFPFWMIACSFRIFGVSEWAYRLPALLFFLLSVFYTYRFSKKYYGQQTALTAVLILSTALHMMLSNADVRAEPYLMGLLIGSVYHISNLKDRFKKTDLFLAAFFTAAAIMTKGIFVAIPLGGSLLAQLFFLKDLKSLISIKWLLLILLILLFITPELFSLYQQFDLQPEKTVFGKQHVSGIRWFLWDSQFGRFINSGPINRKSQGSIFFYLHTLLWAFAPWCLLLYYAFFRNIKRIINRQAQPEYYAFGGGIVLLLLFSFSGFQLPFYTNAVFPLFAVITAPVVTTCLKPVPEKLKLISLWLFIIALPLAVVVLNFYLQPHNYFFWIACLLFFVALSAITTGGNQENKIFFAACCAALFAGLYLNVVFYRVVTSYNGQIAAARYVNLQPFKNYPVYTLNERDNIFQFYCEKPVLPLKAEYFKDFSSPLPALFYAKQSTLDYLNQHHISYLLIRSFLNYPQENILPEFINEKTRNKTLNHVYLISKPGNRIILPGT